MCDLNIDTECRLLGLKARNLLCGFKAHVRHDVFDRVALQRGGLRELLAHRCHFFVGLLPLRVEQFVFPQRLRQAHHLRAVLLDLGCVVGVGLSSQFAGVGLCAGRLGGSLCLLDLRLLGFDEFAELFGLFFLLLRSRLVCGQLGLLRDQLLLKDV